MPSTVAVIVQQILEDVHLARRYLASSLQAAHLVPLLEQTALQQWSLQPLSNNVPLLLTRFAALSPNLLVPLEGQQVRSGEWADVTAAEELRPIMLLMLTVQSSKFSGCTTPEECQLDAETRTKEVKDSAGKQGGYRLTCLRAAILAAKIVLLCGLQQQCRQPRSNGLAVLAPYQRQTRPCCSCSVLSGC